MSVTCRDYVVSICDDCLAGKGEGCNRPECLFCRFSMFDILGAVLPSVRDLLTPAPAMSGLTSEERDEIVRRLRIIRPTGGCCCRVLDGEQCVQCHVDAILAALTREQAGDLSEKRTQISDSEQAGGEADRQGPDPRCTAHLAGGCGPECVPRCEWLGKPAMPAPCGHAELLREAANDLRSLMRNREITEADTWQTEDLAKRIDASLADPACSRQSARGDRGEG